MSQDEKMKNDFIELLEGYYMQLVYLKDLIAVQEDIEKHEKELEIAPNFSLIAACGLIDSYMIAFAKLFGKSNKEMTISYLLEKSSKNLFMFTDQDLVKKKVEEYKKRIENDEYISYGIEIVRKRRDRIIAHNDKKYFGVKISDDTSYLPKYNLWMMQNFIEEVLGFLSSQLDFIPKHSSPKYDGDLIKLFTTVEHI